MLRPFDKIGTGFTLQVMLSTNGYLNPLVLSVAKSKGEQNIVTT